MFLVSPRCPHLKIHKAYALDKPLAQTDEQAQRDDVGYISVDSTDALHNSD